MNSEKSGFMIPKLRKYTYIIIYNTICNIVFICNTKKKTKINFFALMNTCTTDCNTKVFSLNSPALIQCVIKTDKIVKV